MRQPNFKACSCQRQSVIERAIREDVGFDAFEYAKTPAVFPVQPVRLGLLFTDFFFA
jgi:hypothetical protein